MGVCAAQLIVLLQLGADIFQMGARLRFGIGDDPDVRIGVLQGAAEHVGQRHHSALGAAAGPEHVEAETALGARTVQLACDPLMQTRRGQAKMVRQEAAAPGEQVELGDLAILPGGRGAMAAAVDHPQHELDERLGRLISGGWRRNHVTPSFAPAWVMSAGGSASMTSTGTLEIDAATPTSSSKSRSRRASSTTSTAKVSTKCSTSAAI